MSLAPFIMALKRKKSLKFCAIGCIIKEETRKGGGIITLQQQIEMARIYAGLTKSELAERLGYNSLPAFLKRFNTGKFTKEEMEKIASVLNAEWECYFKFPDGKEI